MTDKQAFRYVLVGHPHKEGDYSCMTRRAFVVGVYDSLDEAHAVQERLTDEGKRWTPDGQDPDRTTYPVMYVTHWVTQEVVA